MGYRSLAECVRDLEATGQLIVIDQEVDPYLEVAAIQRTGLSGRRPCPALPATPRGRRSRSWATCSARSTGRSTCFATHSNRCACWSSSRSTRAASARIPGVTAASPAHSGGCCPAASGPGRSWRTRSTLDRLPQIQCWPMDGGPFVTLAAGLHRGSRPARPGAIQPGHVPRAARGQRLRAEPRGRAALSDPPRHRRAPRRRDRARRSRCGSTSSSAARPP